MPKMTVIPHSTILVPSQIWIEAIAVMLIIKKHYQVVGFSPYFALSIVTTVLINPNLDEIYIELWLSHEWLLYCYK